MPQALINVHAILQDFNPNKFVVYFSSLIFTILLSLKLDNQISLPYWFVFLPLWIWKTIAMTGGLVGAIVWFRNPNYQMSHSSYIHFKSMLISMSLQLLLIMFEIMACDKLESKRHSWSLTFTPLVFLSILCVPVCVWSVKNGRAIELELFAAINTLQFLLIAMKLDNFVLWSWVIVFTPSWILLCFAVVIILYAMIFAAIVLRSPEIGTEQRRASIHSASSFSVCFLPMLMFIILLTSKLDSPPNTLTLNYFFTFVPLFVTFMVLMRMSFGSKSGSLWWFGMRADFCTYLLRICPCLKEYGNTSFSVMGRQNTNTVADSNGEPVAAHSSQFNWPPAGGEPLDHRTTRSGNQDHGPNDGHHPKRLMYSISRALFRDKHRHHRSLEEQQAPVASKLYINTPD